MNRTAWLQDRRMQKFRDVLSRWGRGAWPRRASSARIERSRDAPKHGNIPQRGDALEVAMASFPFGDGAFDLGKCSAGAVIESDQSLANDKGREIGDVLAYVVVFMRAVNPKKYNRCRPDPAKFARVGVMHAKPTVRQSKLCNGFLEIKAGAPAVRINASNGRMVGTHLRGLDQPAGNAALEGSDLDNLAAGWRHRREVCHQSAFTLGAAAGDRLQLSQPLCANPSRQRFRLTFEVIIRIESPRHRTRGADRKTYNILRDASRRPCVIHGADQDSINADSDSGNSLDSPNDSKSRG